jgi:acyl-coenzyme A synthetase/AMP-(fatty) acid ligase
VRRSFVTTCANGQGGRELAAFVVPDGADCDGEALRTHLRRHLPGYMVPAVLRLRAELPLTATGKVDRQALLASLDRVSAPAGASS